MYSRPCGNEGLSVSIAALDLAGDVQRVGAGKLEDGDAGGGLAADLAPLVVDLGAELDAGHVLEARQGDPGPSLVAGLDDDVVELLGVAEPPERRDGVLERLVRGRRVLADLAGGDLHVLLADRGQHVLGGQVAGLELLGVEPDPHAVVAAAEDLDVADAGDAAQLVLDAERGVVAQEQVVVAPVGRGQRDGQDDVGRLLLGGDALPLHLLRAACGTAMATRFCTSTCARSRLVPISKVTVSLYEPSLEQVDDM